MVGGGTLGTCGVGVGQGQEMNWKEEWTASASGRAWACGGELGLVASVNLAPVFRRVRAVGGGSAPYLEFLQERDTAERGPMFQRSLTSLLLGGVGIMPSFYPLREVICPKSHRGWVG